MELIPGLPDDIALECLLRLPPASHFSARCVCHRWNSLIRNRTFYQERKRAGHTRKLACFVQARPTTGVADKPIPTLSYRLTLFDPETRTWELIKPIPGYPNGVPLFCQLTSVERELVVMGGWDPTTWQPLRSVWAYSFGGGGWRRGEDMLTERSLFAAAGGGDGRVYVAGGHDEEKNALRTAATYDVREDRWQGLPEMEDERDECEGVMVGGEFWVVSGYETEVQGRFVGTAEVYEVATGRWRREEEVWAEGCPMGGVGLGREGRLASWAEWKPPTSVGVCGVRVEKRLVLAGAAGNGEAMGFCMSDLDGRKFEQIVLPVEFSGPVQSGCCVEI